MIKPTQASHQGACLPTVVGHCSQNYHSGHNRLPLGGSNRKYRLSRLEVIDIEDIPSFWQEINFLPTPAYTHSLAGWLHSHSQPAWLLISKLLSLSLSLSPYPSPSPSLHLSHSFPAPSADTCGEHWSGGVPASPAVHPGGGGLTAGQDSPGGSTGHRLDN